MAVFCPAGTPVEAMVTLIVNVTVEPAVIAPMLNDTVGLLMVMERRTAVPVAVVPAGGAESVTVGVLV
jgi:hypothetical protein